jgi:threonylcarbamoyladenosine tRNA methylthiotransferase MtaB
MSDILHTPDIPDTLHTSNKQVNRPTFAVTTLGCKVNQADSEAISEQMSNAGYVQRDFNEPADVYIVNTCTVTHLGDRSSRTLISQAHRRHPDALLVVTGCYAERSPSDVAALAGVDLVIGNTQKDALVDVIIHHQQTQPALRTSETDNTLNMPVQKRPLLPLIDQQHIGSDETLQNALLEPQPDNPSSLLSTLSESSATTRFTSRTRVQMKVQDGCDNRCTYCIVPTVRGHSRSRSIASVVEQVQRKTRLGYQEVVLTGIHLGDYHPDADEHLDLGHLIDALLRETDIPRIRVSSLEPEDFRLEWLDLWSNPRMCRHLHLPMQSGSDAILRRMARRYISARYDTIVTEAKRLVPGIAISTDIITGFPGETDEDFEQTFQLATKLQFAKSHVFRFSPRQGTAAARMKGQIRDEVKKARSERLLALHEDHSRLFRQQFLGETVEVLVEHPRHDKWEGLTDNYVRVELHDLPQLPSPTTTWQHSLIKARLTHLVDDGVYGVYNA